VGQRPDQLGDAESRFVRRGDSIEADEVVETAAAREEIEQTRADMSSTLDAIQEKLDPEVLSEQAKDTTREVADHAIREAKVAAQEVADHAIEQGKEAVREITDQAVQQAKETVREMTDQAKMALREATIGKVETMAKNATETTGGLSHTVVETIKAHPVPAAVAGLSLGWLFLNRSSGAGQPGYQGAAAYRAPAYGQYGPSQRGGRSGTADQIQATVGQVTDRAQQTTGQAFDTAGQVAGQVQDTAGQVAGQVQETAGHMVGQVQDTAGQVVDQAQEQVSRAQGFLQEQLDENPLVVGAVAIALGGVLAAAMHPTRREDQLLGETRDRLLGSAQELTQDTMQKVGRVMDEAQTTAKQEAQKQELLPQR